jgi:hypothetical protein
MTITGWLWLVQAACIYTIIIKEKSFFKDSIRFEMGYGDDGYEVYLNG